VSAHVSGAWVAAVEAADQPTHDPEASHADDDCAIARGWLGEIAGVPVPDVLLHVVCQYGEIGHGRG
jgi:hypothetical protein